MIDPTRPPENVVYTWIFSNIHVNADGIIVAINWSYSASHEGRTASVSDFWQLKPPLEGGDVLPVETIVANADGFGQALLEGWAHSQLGTRPLRTAVLTQLAYLINQDIQEVGLS
jgi:hypothetical protein